MNDLASERANTFSQKLRQLMDSEFASGFPWNLTIQTKNLRGEALTIAATEHSALLWPNTRAEENRLRRGGYDGESGSIFERGNLSDPLQEARYLSQFAFPRRPVESRVVAVDPAFETPRLDFEHFPGCWTILNLATNPLRLPRLLVCLSCNRRRGRWRRPRSVWVYSKPFSRYIPIDDDWNVEWTQFREALDEVQRQATLSEASQDR